MERGCDLLFDEMEAGLANWEGAEVLQVNKGLGKCIDRMDSAGSSLCSLANSSSLLSRTSTGEFSTGECFSLICTEECLDESLGLVEGEALAPMAQFCGQDVGCCSPAPELRPASCIEVCLMIRQDLQKQREVAQAPACGRRATCAPPPAGPVASSLQLPGIDAADHVDSTAPATASTSAQATAGNGFGAGCSCSAAVPAAPLRLPPAHRTRIVGWMRQVAEALGLHLATLFAAGSLLDRFVAASEDLPPDSMLQLLAIACMSVAVKYEEVGQLAPGVWLSLAVDCEGRPIYQAQDLQRMEWVILQALHWRLHVPNTYTFLSQFLMCLPHAAPAAPAPGAAVQTAPMAAAAAVADATAGREAPAPAAQPQVPGAAAETSGVAQWLPVTSRAVMLAEMSLLNDGFLGYDPSTVALACVALAERMLCCGAGGAACLASAAASGITSGTVPCAFAPCGCPPGVCALGAGVVGAGVTVSAAAVSSAAGVWLGALAPGLEPCAVALCHCHVQMVREQQAAATLQQL